MVLKDLLIPEQIVPQGEDAVGYAGKEQGELELSGDGAEMESI